MMDLQTLRIMRKVMKVFDLKYFYLIITMIFFLVGSLSCIQRKSEEECIINFHYAKTIIPLIAITVKGQCEMNSKMWSGAIEKGMDFQIAVGIITEYYNLSGLKDRNNKHKNDIEIILKNLNSCSCINPDALKKLTELFSTYSQLHSLASSPSGSLIYYNNKVNELNINIVSISSELEVISPLNNEKIEKSVDTLVRKFILEYANFTEQNKEKSEKASQKMIKLARELL